LTDEEKKAIVASTEFVDFIDQTSKLMERCLSEPYDFMRDYTAAADTDACVYLHD
jgi:dynein intermediate chain